MGTKAAREKISTTIARENYAYLSTLVDSGQASSLAEALDRIVTRFRRAEKRRSLEQATADYFAGLSGEAIREENSLARAAHEAAAMIDYDREL
jgi:hypothetical protein